jgi:hypothetical protein
MLDAHFAACSARSTFRLLLLLVANHSNLESEGAALVYVRDSILTTSCACVALAPLLLLLLLMRAC